MIGIISYGAYIPRTRLPLSVIGGRKPKEGGPERAVAWNDEDALTLGAAAAIHCLEGIDRSQVDMLLFASTTLPFQEKQAAALIARVLDLGREVQTADHTGSTRAGTSALRAAFDAVKAGSARTALVITSDARLAAPKSGMEANFGDGAAAFLIADGDAIATLEGFHAVSDEITDVWRPIGHEFTHTWEERFVIQESYTPNMRASVSGLLEGSGTQITDYDRVALYAPDARSHGRLAKDVGAAKEAIQAPLFGQLGNAGAAFAPLLLVAALERAKPGERILLANFGNGADATSFRTTDQIEKLEARRGVAWHLPRRRVVADYDDYVKAKGFATSEWDAGTNPGLSATILYRERDDDLSLLGQQCRSCNAIQFPAQRLCESCFAKDNFERVRLSDRTGQVVTYTFDYFFPTPNPPTVVTIVDVDGARIHLQVVEVDPDQMKIGQEVEFIFRKIHESGGRPNYYWKGIPKPESL
ncbi:MAG: hydroxymethylglutaryl-CoA synthase family protein [bacterium]|nr:3-hydroxy-3-methylglutaryl CoA synthase [Deltaproteobacteria bacterium]MCP4907761.1 hydroxymethylglutaryl-CoA synthase family protein [bacterium]